MGKIRKPFQGVLNIIRFNWHFYAIASALIFVLLFIANYFNESLQFLITLFCALVLGTISVSLLTSFYIYDISGLYTLNWINKRNTDKLIVNINAGFDETSALLKKKFSTAELIALDFYDPKKHTEISIKRARKVYSAFPETRQVETTDLTLPGNSADKIFVILSAHEIRDHIERTAFFKELNRIVKPNGQVYVTEHLRDFPNFLAYTIGFFHFYSKKTWLKTFYNSGLKLNKEVKITPFISTFILCKDGNTL